jgi:hypothetical protein
VQEAYLEAVRQLEVVLEEDLVEALLVAHLGQLDLVEALLVEAYLEAVRQLEVDLEEAFVEPPEEQLDLVEVQFELVELVVELEQGPLAEEQLDQLLDLDFVLVVMQVHVMLPHLGEHR